VKSFLRQTVSFFRPGHRYLGLIYHVIHHTAHHRSAPLRPEDVEDLAAEVLLQIVANDYAVINKTDTITKDPITGLPSIKRLKTI